MKEKAAPKKSKKDKDAELNKIIIVNTNRVISQHIGNWKVAVDSARNPGFPRRQLLYELYENVRLDGHLTAVMGKRAMAITNQRVQWIPEDKEAVLSNKLLELTVQAPWFYELMKLACEAVPFGHSLIEMVPGRDGFIEKAKLINRANVIPELGFLMWNYYNLPAQMNTGSSEMDRRYLNETLGTFYRDDPQYQNRLIEVGGEKDYGLLMQAAQYVIYKRGAFGDWAQFAELFGMPFRVGKYNPYDPTSRKLLDEGLTKMGGAGHATIPHGTEIGFHDNNSSGKSEIFKDLRAACNEEISEIFLGNTLTTNAGEKGARSLGEVHKGAEEDVNISDMICMEYKLNWDLKRNLKNLGYPLGEGKFCFPETSTIPLEKRIVVDMQLARVVDMDPEYFYKTYGISKPGPGVIPVRITSTDPFGIPADEEEEQTTEASNAEATEEEETESKKPGAKTKKLLKKMNVRVTGKLNFKQMHKAVENIYIHSH